MAKRKKNTKKDVTLSKQEVMDLMKAQEVSEPLPNNVISLTERKKSNERKFQPAPPDHVVFSFDEIMIKNKQNQDRLSRERNKGNKNITRACRLKKS